MKILLVNPPAREIVHESVVVAPLGLAYIGSLLEREGYEVKVMDAFALGLTWKEFGKRIKSENADLIGIGGMTPVIDNSFKAIKICRKYAKYVVMGGPHATANITNIFRECPELDFAVYGEGEYTMLELVKTIEGKGDFSEIKGLAARDRINEPRQLIKDLDFLPFPARHLLPNNKYRYALAKHKMVTTIFTSRGCPYQCIFCDKSVSGSKWRARSVENVLEEIEETVKKFKVNSLIIYDDLFTLRRERVIGICRGIIKKGLDIDWKCEGRVDGMDEEELRWMKRAGCSLIAYGVESGNQKSLDYLRKGTTPEQVRRTFKLTREAKIETLAYFVLGIPVETYKEAIRSIEFAKEIDPTYAQFSLLTPFPGTPLYKEAIERGGYREIAAGNPLDKDLKRPVVLSENWTESRLQRIIKESHKRFYFRPSYILKRLFALRSVNQLEFLFKTGWDLIKWYLRRSK